MPLLEKVENPMRQIKKAVIPAAGWGTRFLPATKSVPKSMLPIVDKPAIQYIVEEALEAGIEDIAIIVGEKAQVIERHFRSNPELEALLIEKNNEELLDAVRRLNRLGNVHFVEQGQALGLGHSVWCARDFVGNEPFAVLLGDMICDEPEFGIKSLMEVYEEKQASVIGVQPVPWSEAGKFGVIAGDSLDGPLFFLKGLVEKPQGTPPSNLAIIGRYILEPQIFEILESTPAGSGGEIQLTDALQRQLHHRDIYAYSIQSPMYDIGNKFGFLKATVHMALKHNQVKGEFGMYLQQLVAASGSLPLEKE